MGGKSTTSSSAEPWKVIQPNLKDIAAEGEDIFESGGFSADPYSGDRLAGFGNASTSAQNMITKLANQGTVGTDAAMSSLTGMMNGANNYDFSGSTQGLEAAKSNALGSAIPAATAMFSGAGLADSTTAMDTVGRAATEAVAPYEYDAWNQLEQNKLAAWGQQNANTLSAAGMMPTLEQAQYAPAQMLQSVGTMQDLMSQAQIDSDMQAYYEAQNQDAANVQGYANLLNPIATMGGSSTSTTSTSPGIGDILGTGLQMMALFSDRRTKENIAKIGEHKGHNIYAFNYLWSPTLEFGVMADEVPHAVCGDVGGYAVVDYARL